MALTVGFGIKLLFTVGYLSTVMPQLDGSR
jgi:hypothetical protein